MIEKSRRESLIIRINNNTLRNSNGCLEWIATKNNKGYGLIHFAKAWGEGWNSSIPVHRAHYMAFHNVILERNQFVCHKCDNPACVEITHLFLGTPKDNMQDMIAKGRNSKEYIFHKRVRVFTDQQIIEIREAQGLLRDVAEKYGVSVGYVSKLRNMKAKILI